MENHQSSQIRTLTYLENEDHPVFGTLVEQILHLLGTKLIFSDIIIHQRLRLCSDRISPIFVKGSDHCFGHMRSVSRIEQNLSITQANNPTKMRKSQIDLVQTANQRRASRTRILLQHL